MIKSTISCGWGSIRVKVQRDLVRAAGFCRHRSLRYISEGVLQSVELDVSNATRASFNGELFSIGFFVYDGRNSREDGAVLGYRFIYERLLAKYGEPADATVRPFDEATSCWNVNGTSIEMYC